jgi:hypothetical protein
MINGCKLIIKSKLYKHTSDGLHVFNGFLKNAEYQQLYKDCTCVISLLDDSYKYRISGTLIDALSANKPLISLNSICAKYYQTYFGSSIMIYDNFKELMVGIVNFRPSNDISPYSKKLKVTYRGDYIENVQKAFS